MSEDMQIVNKNLEQRTAHLDQVNKELEAFTYSVSHDLRAPLRHISGFAELLAKQIGGKTGSDEVFHKYLAKIMGSSQRMGTLIDDLLALSRLGRSEIVMADIDMDAIIKKIKSDFDAETVDQDITWKIQPLPKIRGDHTLIKQIFTNLISNAIKFSSPRKKIVIEIGAKIENNQVELYVKDNGVGFDMQYADKLFGVFQRLHSRDEFEGTGIGLAIVGRLMGRLNGKVRAEAQLDKGATFYLVLPYKNEGVNNG